jgi:multiple sugar transport system substrate-binding protein
MFSKNKNTKHVTRNRPAARRGAADMLAPQFNVAGRSHTITEVSVMKRLISRASAIAVLAMLAFSSTIHAQTKTITLCWAAWDPANALVELSKDFTTKTGIQMKFEFVPWPNFADRMLNELNSKGKLCDLMIGDSQWIGGAAENGQYVKLNDFFAKEGIKMSDFMPATVTGYSEWPKHTPNYYALPAMGDSVGWTYRKDWFNRPEIRTEFKAKYNRDLAPPKTWDEFKQVAEFFQNRAIDGKKVYGAYIFTERGSEGITMGVTNVLYPYGFKYDDPKKPYSMNGFVNSAESVKGLEFRRSAVLHVARAHQRVHAGGSRRVQIGASGDDDELVRIFPGTLQGSECRW